jgi:predicted short-subunit dehydrogenase-like oxidoreductase (DUF2520 family)
VNLILVGPGRAGMSVALRCVASGHRLAGVLARRPDAADRAGARLGTVRLEWDADLPPADLVLVAVSDDAIAGVGARLAPMAGAVEGAVHLSGLVSVSALATLAPRCPIGSFHPLQTLPDPDLGSSLLEGCWVAVTGDEPLASRLQSLAVSLGARPFALADASKPIYHAAASAAANFPVAALALSRRLFEAAGVDFEVAFPLIRGAIGSTLALGPEAAMTGPVARGDLGTVAAQLAAVRDAAPAELDDFRAMARAAARTAGSAGLFSRVLE